MCFDHLLPIFFEDHRALAPNPSSLPGFLHFPGGLGLSMNSVGLVMAVNGVIALFIQAVVFPLAAERIGVYQLFLAVTLVHPMACLLMPYLVWVPASSSLFWPAVYTCLTIRDMLSILEYPLLLILIKEATPSSAVLGTVNGFAASAGAACRMLAPPVAGLLYTLGSRVDCTALAWWASGLVAVGGALQCFCVERPRGCAGGGESEAEAQLKTPLCVRVSVVSEEEDDD